MSSVSMRPLIKALVGSAVLMAVMVCFFFVLLKIFSSWPPEMKTIFDLYLFPISIFFIGGVGVISFVKILVKEK